MSRSRIALKDFLARHCRPQPATAAQTYLFPISDGRMFMAESHLREIFQALKRTLTPGAPALPFIEVARDSLRPSVIDHLNIPAHLADMLEEQEAFLVLRHLEAIQKDIEEGRLYASGLRSLFGDTASILINADANGARVFEISGTLSPSDKRRYIERYAEQVASQTLFDVAKALNARLSPFVPDDYRGRHFIEGQDFSDRKIRYGQDVGTEISLSDEGAWLYTQQMTDTEQQETLTRYCRQAMLDPFGLSMTHYMGKHNVLKAGKRPLVKLPPLSGLIVWFRGLFARA